MRFRFFTVEALPPTAGGAELNVSCAQHRIASVGKQFVDQGGTVSGCPGAAPAGESVAVLAEHLARERALSPKPRRRIARSAGGLCFAVFVSVRALSSPAGASWRAFAPRCSAPPNSPWRRSTAARVSVFASGCWRRTDLIYIEIEAQGCRSL